MIPDKNIPQLLQGGSHTDHRGCISFVNGFDMSGIDRFYTLALPRAGITRAWQGHRMEAKYYFPVQGRWRLAWVYMDKDIPIAEWKPEVVELHSSENKMLYLPPGYASGIQTLEDHGIMLGFSVPGPEPEDILRWDARMWGVFKD